MTLFIIHRLLQSLAVLIAMTAIVFFGVHLVGNPVDVLAGPNCDQACRQQTIVQFGLDRPIWEQYFAFLGNLLQGEIGRSFAYGLPAMDVILERMPATIELAVAAMLLGIVVGFPLGMWAGLYRKSPSARMIMGFSILGFSVPTFWIGIVLIMVFAVELGLLPATGRGETVEVFGARLSFLTLDGLRHLALPAITLALYKVSLLIRLTRSGTSEVILSDYIRFARAKGLRPARILGVHATKNIMIPIITVLGLEFGSLIAFAVVTETIFSWPGMGKLIIDSIKVLDRPVIVAYLMLTVCIFVLINLVVDVAYSFLDPRVRLGTSR